MPTSEQSPSTRVRSPKADAEQQIERLLTRWKDAMERKDGATAAACYMEDAVIFGLAPPLRARGVDQRALQAWLDSWQTGPSYEMREVQLITDRDLAYCVSLSHMAGTKVSGEQVDLWFRASVCLRRLGSEWRIAHEHTSVPFLMDGSFKAAVDLRPRDDSGDH
jgi:ketosteroid isomerase-like protein